MTTIPTIPTEFDIYSSMEGSEAANEDARDDEPTICGCCNGSGEGMYDGSTCGACRGSGEVRDLEAEREREADRADFLRDQMNDLDLERAPDYSYDSRFDAPDDDLPY